MNRKAIRLASKELGLKTDYTAMQLLRTLGSRGNALRSKATELIWKRTTIKTDADIEKAWQYAVEGSRGDVVEVS
jgi:phosphoribosylglycinamide formyltransferase 2